MVKSKLAIASFVLGVLACAIALLLNFISRGNIFGVMALISMLFSVLAFIFGIIAIILISQNSNLKGNGFAIMGIILGVVYWLLYVYASIILL